MTVYIHDVEFNGSKVTALGFESAYKRSDERAYAFQSAKNFNCLSVDEKSTLPVHTSRKGFAVAIGRVGKGSSKVGGICVIVRDACQVVEFNRFQNF